MFSALWVTGKKIVKEAEITFIHMLWNIREKQIEILKDIQFICLCCFDQAVQNSTGFYSIGRFNQNKFLRPRVNGRIACSA